MLFPFKKHRKFYVGMKIRTLAINWGRTDTIQKYFVCDMFYKYYVDLYENLVHKTKIDNMNELFSLGTTPALLVRDL